MNSSKMFGLASRCCHMITRSGQFSFQYKLDLPVTSSCRQYSEVSAIIEMPTEMYEGKEEEVKDITVLPCGDCVVAINGLKRFTSDGQHVWTHHADGFQPKSVCYVPGSDKLLSVNRDCTVCWVNLDGTMGEQVTSVGLAMHVCAHYEHVYMRLREEERVVAVDFNSGQNDIVRQLDVPKRARNICCLNNGTVVLSSGYRHSVLAFGPGGERLWQYGGGRTGLLSCPRGVCAAPTGGLFVADFNHECVKEISASGEHVRDVITKEDGLERPGNVEMNKEGQLLVAELKTIKVVNLDLQKAFK